MDNKIFITDDNGKEIEMNVLFTFDANNKNYAVVYENGKDDELFAFIYDDNGNLYEVEDEDELAMVQEVIDSFDGIEDEEEA